MSTHAGKQLKYKIEGNPIWVDTSYATSIIDYSEGTDTISYNKFIDNKLQSEIKFTDYYKTSKSVVNPA